MDGPSSTCRSSSFLREGRRLARGWRARKEPRRSDRRGPPGGEAAPCVRRSASLDHRPDPAVARVVGNRALGEIPLPHLREVVRGMEEFEQRLEACEVRGELTLPIALYGAELLGDRGRDVV